jgi:hypothetical protein
MGASLALPFKDKWRTAMRKLLVRATVVAFGVSIAVDATAALSLQGSDTLEEVTKDVIGVCSLGPLINYVGGGSGTGQAAMVAGTQQVAPMSRELNGTACTASASQLLIGLDGLAIVASNQLFGDSLNQTPQDQTDDCSDSVSGGNSLPVPGCTAADGCTTPGTYVFTDWRDVLAMIYGGQNHTAAAQLINRARNPARINCASSVRQALVNNWAAIFADSGVDPQACRSDSCLKLKHAFRRGDLSGTTDTFVSLVGLPAVAPYTTTFANFVPTKDGTATANPFCNAGEALMNKGDSDYLDLDPIRRIADSDSASTGRMGLEQVAQGYAVPSNPPAIPGIDNRVEPAVGVLADYATSTQPNIYPDPNVANSLALQRAALPMRRGLGLVLVIEVPPNYSDERIAYFSTVPFNGEPALCTSGKFALSIPDTQHPSTAICPDGTSQPCLLPVNLDNPAAPNFNCLSNSPVPASPPVRDSRVYNLLVVDGNGKYVRDSYVNPNLPGLATIRQNRVVSAFYRLHTSQTTYLGGFPTGINCKKLSSTEQIGCLVEANPCSIGFAGREAVDNILNMAFQVQGIKPTAANISNLVNGSGGPVYPISRKLWLNALNGFGSVTGDQNSLLSCFRGMVPGVSLDTIDSIIQNRTFVPVPAGVARTKSCPAVFP